MASHNAFDAEHLPTGFVEVSAMLRAPVEALHGVFDRQVEEWAGKCAQERRTLIEGKGEKVLAGFCHAGGAKRGDAAAIVVLKALQGSGELFIDVEHDASLSRARSGSWSFVGRYDLVHESFEELHLVIGENDGGTRIERDCGRGCGEDE